MKRIPKPIILALLVGLFIIALHQTVINGFANSYWLFMLVLGIYFLYNYSGRKKEDKEES